MTTYVIVKNKEGSHWEVTVEMLKKMGEGTYWPAEARTLKPGEETEVMIHSELDLRIKEGKPV